MYACTFTLDSKRRKHLKVLRFNFQKKYFFMTAKNHKLYSSEYHEYLVYNRVQKCVHSRKKRKKKDNFF